MRLSRISLLAAAALLETCASHAPAFAQTPAPTAVPIAQVSAPAQAAPVLLVIGVDGKLSAAALPAGVTLAKQPNGTYVISVAWAVKPVRNEVPAAGPAAGTWTLAAAPPNGAACFRNGLRQLPGLDYTLSGATITSPYWAAGDILLCDY